MEQTEQRSSKPNRLRVEAVLTAPRICHCRALPNALFTEPFIQHVRMKKVTRIYVCFCLGP